MRDTMHTNLVKKFCTPPVSEITNIDTKLLSKAKKTEISFEGNMLPVFTWGEGKTVMLLHGWGSRASHLAIMARILVQAGFRVVTFDAPAHSSVKNNTLKVTTNMFEFGRSLFAVANQTGKIHALIGYSLGAATSAFIVSGFLKMAKYKISLQKLVLISSPSSIDAMIDHFSDNYNLSPNEKTKLKEEVEKEFDLTILDYSVGTALKNSTVDLMLIHDKDDNEFPISNVYKIHKDCRSATLAITEGHGHHKILLDRNILNKISDFLTTN
ncbi:MAG: alpha/beta hydrolase [Bacteroidales bacterium]|nr:alpha/beta hydrolase [Bacteroidales bacterium]